MRSEGTNGAVPPRYAMSPHKSRRWRQTTWLVFPAAVGAWWTAPAAEVRADLAVQIAGSYYVPAPAPTDRTSPSWPWSWLGLIINTTVAPGPVDGTVYGSSNFAFPDFPPGTIVVPSVDAGPIAYASIFSDAAIGGSASFSGSLNFHYKIACKRGNPTLTTFSVSSWPAGTTTDGAHLTPGAASQTPHDNRTGLSDSIDFPPKPLNAAGVSASLDADMSQTHNLNWAPAVRYGYYVWSNIDGSLSAADSLTFIDVPDGGVLSVRFPPPPLGASSYFANFLPAVKIRIDITQTVDPQGQPVGSLHAYLPGWSKDYTFPPLPPIKLATGTASLTYEAQFYGIQYQSIPLAGGPNVFQVVGLPTFSRNDFLVGWQGVTGGIGSPGPFLQVQGFNVGVPDPPPVIINNTPYAPDDPTLARVIPGLTPRSDFNLDDDVDDADLAAQENCFSGPAIQLAPGCEAMDLDHDGDVDQADFGLVQRCYSGANIPGNPACDSVPPMVRNPAVDGVLARYLATAITVSCTATDTDGTVQFVTADLSAIGGSNAQSLTQTAAATWSWSGTVNPTSIGVMLCTFTATDNLGATGTASVSVEVVPASMALIPAGQFQMGDQSVPFDGGTTERPMHTVYVDAFYMDRTEVTNQQYAEGLNWAIAQGGLIYVFSDGVVYRQNSTTPYCTTSLIAYNGYAFSVVPGRESQPMVTVSWYGAVAYANWRSAMEGKPLSYDMSVFPPTCNWGSGYRLPTEAEWEKAARGGAVGHRFPWSDSDDIQHARANYASSPDFWYDNSPTRGFHPLFQGLGYPYTSPVGYFAANGYGLYDMAGNVSEWCNDWHSGTYYSTPEASQPNPRGPATSPGFYRVLRGGSWQNVADGCRSASRSGDLPGRTSYGFRLVRPSP